MPAVGDGRADIGGAGRVLDECAGLEQVGSTAAAGGDAEIGTAAGQREPGDRCRRKPVVCAGRDAKNAAGGGALTPVAARLEPTVLVINLAPLLLFSVAWPSQPI